MSAEIEYPLAGSQLPPDFHAGGEFDLNSPLSPAKQIPGSTAPPLPPPMVVIRCKLMTTSTATNPSSTLIATSTDFLVPPGVTTGFWDVSFTAGPGTNTHCKVCSFMVVNGTEHLQECSFDMSVGCTAAGLPGPMPGDTLTVTITMPPLPPPLPKP